MGEDAWLEAAYEERYELPDEWLDSDHYNEGEDDDDD